MDGCCAGACMAMGDEAMGAVVAGTCDVGAGAGALAGGAAALAGGAEARGGEAARPRRGMSST
jgi:hypothetical protein